MPHDSSVMFAQGAKIEDPAEKSSSSLGDKLGVIEHDVMDSVQDTTTAVSETVATIKAGLSESMDSIKDAVQGTVASFGHALDIRDHVRQHPWLMLGGAVFVGYVIGNLVYRPQR
jgi:ElaB/YqjD/DUF883 family membrane-anchored ribosome-binding protein